MLAKKLISLIDIKTFLLNIAHEIFWDAEYKAPLEIISFKKEKGNKYKLRNFID